MSTSNLTAKGFAIPSALDYTKVIAKISAENSSAFARSSCSCNGCKCKSNKSPRQALKW